MKIRFQSKRKMLTSLRAICLILSIMLIGIGGMAGTATASTTYLCSGNSYATCVNSGYTAHGYDSQGGTSYWTMFAGHNCTNYAAYMSIQNGAATPSHNLGNAADWATNAAVSGVTVDGTPAVGAIAQWNAYAGGAGSSGHVSYVEAVNGNTITVSEDNYASGPFTWKTITSGGSDWPSNFIHFADVITPPAPAPKKADLLWASPSPSGSGAQVDTLLSTGSAWSLGWRGDGWTTPSIVESGDFNGDGKKDLLYVIPTGPGTVTVNTVFSTGNGWVNGWQVTGWATPIAIAIGDFNGDGKADLFWVSASPSGGGVEADVLLATPNGWSLGWSGSNWTTPSFVQAGDFNGDGKADLVYVTDTSSTTVNATTLLSTGSGWSTGWQVTDWAKPVMLSSGDYDGDGKTDLLWISPESSGGGVQVDALMSAGYAWRLGWRGQEWTTPYMVTSGDFNGDGRDDVVYVIDTGPSTVDANTLTSTGSGWSTSWQVTGWTKPIAITSGDFNGS